MKNRRWFWIFQGFVALALVGVFLARWQRSQTEEALPDLGAAPVFSLMRADKQPFHSQELKGKVWVASFIFTSCGGVCPMVTSRLAEIHRSYQLEKDVALVSISVDPKRDTPEALKAYGEKYGADFKSWQFLTGPAKEIQRVSQEGMKLGLDDDPMSHSNRVVLFDRQGRIRGYYDGTEREESRRLVKDMARLLREGT